MQLVFIFLLAYLVIHCSHMDSEGWSECFQDLERCSLVNLDQD